MLINGGSRNDKLRDLLANLRRVCGLLDLAAVGRVQTDGRRDLGLLVLADGSSYLVSIYDNRIQILADKVEVGRARDLLKHNRRL